MNIVVCVKQVPDTAVERTLTPEGTLDRASPDGLINEPRYPTFKGIMAAKKKPVQTLTLADLSLDAGSVGLANAASRVEDFAKRPPRAAGVIVKDEGDGGSKTAAFLADRKFI